MKKEHFKTEPKVCDATFLSSSKFQFNNEEFCIDADSDDLDLFMLSSFFSFEQHRKAVYPQKNPLETCIVIDWEEHNRLASIHLKLINYRNKQMFLLFEGYDKKGRFVMETPFSPFQSSNHYRQLSHLFNQDKIYFHIYKDWKFIKHFVEDNPLKGLEELEELLSDIEDIIFDENREVKSDELSLWFIKEFYRKYSKEYIHKLAMDTNEHYYYLD